MSENISQIVNFLSIGANIVLEMFNVEDRVLWQIYNASCEQCL